MLDLPQREWWMVKAHPQDRKCRPNEAIRPKIPPTQCKVSKTMMIITIGKCREETRYDHHSRSASTRSPLNHAPSSPPHDP